MYNNTLQNGNPPETVVATPSARSLEFLNYWITQKSTRFLIKIEKEHCKVLSTNNLLHRRDRFLCC